MGTTYAWHPGAHWLSPGWGVPIALMPDELFSGWLSRAAAQMGCSLSSLLASIAPELHVCDVDRGLSAQQLSLLSGLSGITGKALEASMLLRVSDALAGRDRFQNSILDWVLPLGLQRGRTPHGLQYCTGCWLEDDIPYVRMEWRLAWHIACARHQLALVDHCYRCGAPIRPHQVRSGALCISTCVSCGANLSVARADRVEANALAFQQHADRVIQSGTGRVWGSCMSAAEWFRTVALMLRFIKHEGSQVVVPGNLERRFELLGVADRQVLTAKLAWLMDKSRAQVVRMLSMAYRRGRASGQDEHRSILGWLSLMFPPRPVRAHARTKDYSPRTKQQVKQMMAYLCGLLSKPK